MVDPSPNHPNNKRKHSSSSSHTSKYTHRPSSKQRQTKYSTALNKFIDMESVDINPLKEWVRNYLQARHKDDAALLEDLVFDRLENEKWPDPKVLQTELGDVFMLPQDAREFVKQLWQRLTNEVDSKSRKKARRER